MRTLIASKGQRALEWIGWLVDQGIDLKEGMKKHVCNTVDEK